MPHSEDRRLRCACSSSSAQWSLLVVVVVVAVMWEDRRESGKVAASNVPGAPAVVPSPPRSRWRPPSYRRRRCQLEAVRGGQFLRAGFWSCGRAGGAGEHLSPPGYLESVRRRLTIAGRGRQVDVNRFLAGRVATIALIPVAFIAVEFAPLPKLYRLLAFLVAVLLLVLGPRLASTGRPKRARTRCARTSRRWSTC